MTASLFERAYVAYARTRRHRGQVRLLSWAKPFLPRGRVTVATEFALMRLDVTEAVQNNIVQEGVYEPLTLAAFARLLRPGCFVVDIGAHVGQFTLMASKGVGAAGRVLAIEPNPVTFCELQQNITLNGARNVTPVSCAVAGDARLIRFASSQPGNRGASREAETPMESEFIVGAFKLIDILQAEALGRPDLLKVDVEGAEWRVLEPLLAEPAWRPPDMFLEFLPDYFSYDIGPEAFLAALRQCGYDLFTVEGRPFQSGAPLPEHNIWARLRSFSNLA